MKKTDILDAIINEIDSEIRRIQSANKEASSSATDVEFRAESKWDTGGLEASYLARGYAQQHEQLSRQVNILKAFQLPSFAGKAAGVGALVRCDLDGYQTSMFLLPAGGGIELEFEGEEVTVITLDSPLGRALMDKREMDTFTLPSGLQGNVLKVV